MSEKRNISFAELYAHFGAPIAALNCGEKCAPYNEHGVPFCCDIRHAIPTAYQSEWDYLRASTDLWRLWEDEDPAQTGLLQAQVPTGQVLIACQGFKACQRDFRSLTCRAFPFFPYFNREGDFLGMTYYWEYEERCWVISNLPVISSEYRMEFIAAFNALFEALPDDRRNFQHFSTVMRRVFGRRKRAIPLLHRNGHAYKVSPHNGRMRRIPVERFPKYGPYLIAASLPFPDEINNQLSTLAE